mgnify:CR=1 FL=1|jgi:hypothetical protein
MLKTSGSFSMNAVIEIIATYRDMKKKVAKGKSGKGPKKTCTIGKRNVVRVPEELKVEKRRI